MIEYNASALKPDDLVAIVKKAGFTSRVVADSNRGPTAPTERVESDDPVYVAALARAQKENKPIVIDFSATWCAPCKKMERLTFPDPKVAALLKQCVFLKVDTDKHEKLTKSFGVTGLPDIRFLASDGTPKRRLTDYQAPDAFAKSLREFLAGDQARTKEAKRPPVVDLSDDEAKLKKAFSRQPQHMRMILILSPT